ncbi:box C/D snoRNA protein 1-like [Rhinatrema bivittatum]|uniref:box C/D snoRNA protein 1-like n=1 Tax=Rhinatrema bivittatum TaxID=194408 RepID=UPI00112DFF41|nr:box C/D snoRNA protein 1-like [Rhinatrema bivittatum]
MEEALRLGRERSEESCRISPGMEEARGQKLSEENLGVSPEMEVAAGRELPGDSFCVSETADAVGLKRKMSLYSCETCGSEEAKYRCPRCMKYSCSLPCVKKHKATIRCSGVRDKAAFVSISQFDEMTLLSDYRFLEDVGRSSDCAARDVLLHRPTSCRFLNFMKNRARKHHIDLKILPVGFTKRRQNSTFFSKKFNPKATGSEEDECCNNRSALSINAMLGQIKGP